MSVLGGADAVAWRAQLPAPPGLGLSKDFCPFIHQGTLRHRHAVIIPFAVNDSERIDLAASLIGQRAPTRDQRVMSSYSLVQQWACKRNRQTPRATSPEEI